MYAPEADERAVGNRRESRRFLIVKRTALSSSVEEFLRSNRAPNPELAEVLRSSYWD